MLHLKGHGTMRMFPAIICHVHGLSKQPTWTWSRNVYYLKVNQHFIDFYIEILVPGKQ